MVSTAQLAPQDLHMQREVITLQPSAPSKDIMIKVQSRNYPASSQVESRECIAELYGPPPCTSTNMNPKALMECQLTPGNWAFGNLPSDSHIRKFAKARQQTSNYPQSLDTHRLEEYIAEALKRFHRMGGPVNIPQRKSVNEVLSEYIWALSSKKSAVLALASAQVSCEESEAVLIEVYGEAHLGRIRSVHYVTDDPKSATGRYFDAVSAIRFDPLELEATLSL